MQLMVRGGYNLELSGRPTGDVDIPAIPAQLRIPLFSRRFTFSDLCVEDGATVQRGDILARDPGNRGGLLLAPRSGSVKLGPEQHVTLTLSDSEQPLGTDSTLTGEHTQLHSKDLFPEQIVETLCRHGVWPLLSEAFTGTPAEPGRAPTGIVVTTVHMEPFVARGDAVLGNALRRFARGLEYLQRFLEYEPIYLLLPEVKSSLATKLHDLVRGYAWLRSVLIKRHYPSGNPMLAALELGIGGESGDNVWGLDVTGVLAIDAALTCGQPATDRVIAIGGPAVQRPRHVRVPIGFPIQSLLEFEDDADRIRVINGGVLTGVEVIDQHGVDAECAGLTVLEHQPDREFLGFLRPGADRRSYSRGFLSALLGTGSTRLTTSRRGDRRACIACGSCENVCPARIMPWLIHKRDFADDFDGIEKARVDRCVRCGLCSYVCPSKIELSADIAALQHKLREEQAAVESLT